jgi:LysM repeat protein
MKVREGVNTVFSTAMRSLAAVSVVAAVALAGCASQPSAPAAPAPAAVPVAEAAPPPPSPAAPAAPELSSAQARAQAQKLALEAVDHLQNGDEPGARQVLTTALGLDPANDIARKMLEQINADAQKELGSVFFRYTVQRDDTLSKLAQQYLGDRLRFYILARYNDMANPSRLAAGQVIKIPGKAPAAPAAPATSARTPSGAAETPEPAQGTAVVEPAAAGGGDLAALMQKGRRLQAGGDLQGAYAAFSEAVLRAPGNRDAVIQRDAAKAALVRSYDREATQAFQRQNLDLAIARWDRVLELDPGNQKARLERERAIELKKRMSEKFGTTK